MSKIQFNDREFIEILVDNKDIVVTLSAKDSNRPRAAIVNSAKLTLEQFKELIGPEIIGKLI